MLVHKPGGSGSSLILRLEQEVDSEETVASDWGGTQLAIQGLILHR